MFDKNMLVKEGAEAWDPVRLLEDFFGARKSELPALPKTWAPRVDVQETEKEYILTTPLAGVRKEDVRIEVKDEVLTIVGERKTEKEEKGKTWLRRENSYGSFMRSFVLPEGLHPEDVKASFKDGLLTVTLRKAAQPKRRGIGIKVE